MSSDDPKLKWMYDGPKADVHREDFLLGKQLTKDFELYSDVARKDPDAEKAEAIDKSFIKSVTHSSNRGNKVSALGLDVVMHEDPLVAIKTKAELRKREIYDNPAIQMKLRKALMEEYQHDKAKKEKKKAKKEKKRERKESRSEENQTSSSHHHRRRRRVSSSTPDDSPPRRSRPEANMERKRQEMVQNTNWRNEHRKETIEKTREMYDNPAIQMKLRKASMEEYQHDKAKKERKRERKESRSEENQTSSSHRRHHRRVSTSSSTSSPEKKRERKESRPEENQTSSSHRRHHRRVSTSHYEDKRHRPEPRRRRHDSSAAEEENQTSSSHRRRRRVSTSSSTSSPDDSPPPRRHSRPAEADTKKADMERKRQEMLQNANWRNEHRKETIEKTREMLQKELEDSQANAQAGPSFIRPMLQSAMDDQTLEDSVNARRKRAAGSSRDMQKSFARR